MRQIVTRQRVDRLSLTFIIGIVLKLRQTMYLTFNQNLVEDKNGYVTLDFYSLC